MRQTPLAFHPLAQRNAFRRRDARQQRRSFARKNQWLRHSHGEAKIDISAFGSAAGSGQRR
jgi:hypothetical protein